MREGRRVATFAGNAGGILPHSRVCVCDRRRSFWINALLLIAPFSFAAGRETWGNSRRPPVPAVVAAHLPTPRALAATAATPAPQPTQPTDSPAKQFSLGVAYATRTPHRHHTDTTHTPHIHHTILKGESQDMEGGGRHLLLLKKEKISFNRMHVELKELL